MRFTNYILEMQEQHGVILPNLYKKLAQDNMLDYQLSSRQEWKEKFPKLLENPPFLLICPDLEIPSPDVLMGILQEQLSCETNDYYWLNPIYKHLMIPFAMNGAGDYYVFYFIDGKDKEPVIAIINHDDLSMIICKDLADFIFYQMLKIANAYDWYDEYELEEYRQIILRQLQTHLPYLSNEHYELLKSIYQRQFFESNMSDWVLISKDEMETILNQNLDFSRYEEEFDAYIFECDNK